MRSLHMIFCAYLNSTQNISCAIEPIMEEENKDEIVSNLNAVSIFE